MTTYAANPLLEPSHLPCGLPPFRSIRPEHFPPALAAAREQARREREAIVRDPAPATFDNTVAALERCGLLLQRVRMTFISIVGSESTSELLAIEADLADAWSEFRDETLMDSDLFGRVEAVRDSADQLSAEQTFLVHRWHRDMVCAGAGLRRPERDRLAALNREITGLSTEFSRRLQEETRDLAVVLEDPSELDGLGDDQLRQARQAAEQRGLPDAYLLPLRLATGHPYLASLTNRDTRRRLLDASLKRCRRGGPNDTTGLVVEIARKRAEKARLLGYRDFASWATANETAGTPQAVAELLEPVAAAAMETALRERQALQRLAGHEVAAWDWPFYAAQLRREATDIDARGLRDYFEAETVLTRGAFHAAGLVYGLTFEERPDLDGWNADCRVFTAYDHDGSVLGLYLLDLYARDQKRGGSRSHTLLEQSTLLGQLPIVCSNLTVHKPPEGEPTLLTMEEVRTLFHEFGHALQELMSKVTYPSTAGMHVSRDYIEFAGQVNEMWATWPEVLAHYAVHHQTGEPLPGAVTSRLAELQKLNQGFATSEHLAAALLDQAWHTLTVDDQVTDAGEFESRVLKQIGLDDPAIPPRYASSYFQHIFFAEYAARYYSYMWSEILAVDTIEWFAEQSDDLRAAGDLFRAKVLAPAGSIDAMTAYRDFRGRPPGTGALERHRGLR